MQDKKENTIKGDTKVHHRHRILNTQRENTS